MFLSWFFRFRPRNREPSCCDPEISSPWFGVSGSSAACPSEEYLGHTANTVLSWLDSRLRVLYRLSRIQSDGTSWVDNRTSSHRVSKPSASSPRKVSPRSEKSKNLASHAARLVCRLNISWAWSNPITTWKSFSSFAATVSQGQVPRVSWISSDWVRITTLRKADGNSRHRRRGHLSAD